MLTTVESHVYFYKNEGWNQNTNNSIEQLHTSIFSSAVFGENLRYCYSLGIVGGGSRSVMQKCWQYLISLLLLKIFTWNSEYVFTFQRAVHTIKGDNLKCIFFFRIMPLFRLKHFWHFAISLNISNITEDIDLKLGLYVYYPKRNPYNQGRQFKMHFFRIMPLFLFDFLSSIKHPTAQRWHPHAVLLSCLFTMFSKVLFPTFMKTKVCLVKG